MKYSIGIDIGGTHTDAVLVDDQQNILAKSKVPTTKNINDGLENVLVSLFNRGNLSSSLEGIFIGTTHASNAILEVKNLYKVGVIRLSHQSGNVLPPCCNWPKKMTDNIFCGYRSIAGGIESSDVEISSLNKGELKEAINYLVDQGMESLAIVGVFSPLNNNQENLANYWAKEILGDEFPITLSHNIGGTGFIERENSTVLNAALIKRIKSGFNDIKKTLNDFGLEGPIYLTQNNGTVMTLEEAFQFPILTISSGATNSFIGASRLANRQDAFVVDIGGTSTDIGIVRSGIPRRSLDTTNIGGIGLNFPMPDVISLALGGGSLVNLENGIQIGPESVGHKLFQEAMTFGGNQLTLTDVAFAEGNLSLKNARPNNLPLDSIKSKNIMDYASKKISQNIKKLSPTQQFLPLILTGGGSALFKTLDYRGEIIIPEHADVANAYGAALAEVSGTIDTVVNIDNKSKILDELLEKACESAVKNGARKDSLRVVTRDITPYHYIPQNLARIKITVVGKRIA